jgi:hypothetical protein
MVESSTQSEKSPEPSKQKKISLYIKDSYHVKPLLEHLLSTHASWKETKGKDFQIKWIGPQVQDQEIVELLAQGYTTNKYPDQKDMAAKDNFSELTNFIYALDA